MVNKVQMVVYPKIRDMIRIECKKEFLSHHPEFEGMRITDNLLLTQLAKFYLKG